MDARSWAAVLLLSVWPRLAGADEGGTSVWVPGTFGSLAAVPGLPGLSLSLIYFRNWGIQRGQFEFQRGVRVTTGLSQRNDLLFVAPTWTFARHVAGAQASLGVGTGFGRQHTTVDSTLTEPHGVKRSGTSSDSATGLGDLVALGQLKWALGRSNLLTYAMGGAPIGEYDANALSNVGSNHWALDTGGGYTFFDHRHEFSATVGATYNFENPTTHYRNGIDGHLDYGASLFPTDRFQVGIVGYFYQQLTADSGSGASLGPFKSKVGGVGPQVGLFLLGQRGYVNAKGYWEFYNANRPGGWNIWLNVVLPIFVPK